MSDHPQIQYTSGVSRKAAPLQKAFQLLSQERWSEAVLEIDAVLASARLSGPVARGGALAMKAEAVEKLGDPLCAARLLQEALGEDQAASLQFAELVIRAELSEYYSLAEASLGRLLANSGKDNVSRTVADSLRPLHGELQRRMQMPQVQRGESDNDVN